MVIAYVCILTISQYLSAGMFTAGNISSAKKTLIPIIIVILVVSFARYHLRTSMSPNEENESSLKHFHLPSDDNISLDILYPYQTPPQSLRDILVKGVSKEEASTTVSRSALDLLDEYLKIKDIGDLRQTANPNTSKVFILQNQKHFKIHDTIRIRIELNDGWGRRLLTGGDLLRIWIVDPASGANSSGYVIDHGNGSYTGEVKALWTGNPEIKLSIACTKEHIGIILNHIKEHGALQYLTGRFKKSNTVEDTKCTTIPMVKGYSDVCNLTLENFGMAWYCGKPKSVKLTCRDWTSYSGNTCVYDMSEIAQFLSKYNKQMNFPNTFHISVTGDYTTAQSKDIPCNKRPKNATWYDVSPTGYFYKNHWHVLECKFPFKATKTNYINCLKGRPLIFLGDSTIRYWFVWLTDFLNLKFTLGRWDEIKDKAWQKYAYAESRDLNLSIVWAPHELPFYGGLSYTKNLRSVSARLDEIGSYSKAIVVLHWYLHVAKSPHEVYREHVRNARLSVDRLLQRSPEIELFIKGPHSVTFPLNTEPFDYVRRYEEQILFEEFRDIQDRVTYLDEWDMTVGSENIHVHPSRSTNLEMIHHLLSYACFRK